MAEKYPILTRLGGRSAELVVDNGIEFRGYDFESSAAGAGFAVRFAPIKKPTYKSVGERFFRTIQDKITKRLPGRTIPIREARKREYDAALDAVVTLDDLEALANQGIAEYHTEPHDGLDKRQPALMFERGTGGFIDVAHDIDGFLSECLDVIPEIQVDMAGATRWGLRFHHARNVPDLLDDHAPTDPKRGAREDRSTITKAKFNRMNIGVFKVWNRKTRKWLELVCEDPDYANGLPLELHLQIKDAHEAEGNEFNTEADRRAARTNRIDAIRALDCVTRELAEKEFGKLVENTRIRQITGNIVEAALTRPTAVTIGDFIHHDVAALSSLDEMVLAPRKPLTATKRKRVPARDRRNAGQPHGTTAADATAGEVAARPVRTSTRSTRRVQGEYK